MVTGLRKWSDTWDSYDIRNELRGLINVEIVSFSFCVLLTSIIMIPLLCCPHTLSHCTPSSVETYPVSSDEILPPKPDPGLSVLLIQTSDSQWTPPFSYALSEFTLTQTTYTPYRSPRSSDVVGLGIVVSFCVRLLLPSERVNTIRQSQDRIHLVLRWFCKIRPCTGFSTKTNDSLITECLTCVLYQPPSLSPVLIVSPVFYLYITQPHIKPLSRLS